MLTETLSLLQKLGFSSYESKVYIALISAEAATPYDIARRSGVPSSKVYETLNKLVSKGIAQPCMDTDQNQRYVGLAPEDLLNQLKHTTLSHTRALLPLLKQACAPVTGDFIWSLTDQEKVAAKASEIIREANQTLLISCWPEELSWIQHDLADAEDRGVRIALVHFGYPTLQIGATYHHPVEKTLYQEKSGRGLTLVVDSRVVLIANYRQTGSIDAAWSRNQAFVTVAEDYVKHDVYITKVTRFLDEPLKARFGEQYEKLRDVFDADK